MRRSILAFCFIIVGILFSISVTKRMYGIFQSGSRLTREANEITKLEDEKSELKRKLTQANTPEYIEREARDKLNLALPGEMVIVIPREQIVETPHEIALADKSNWQRWWYLFFE